MTESGWTVSASIGAGGWLILPCVSLQAHFFFFSTVYTALTGAMQLSTQHQAAAALSPSIAVLSNSLLFF